jgi:hypothetical protein
MICGLFRSMERFDAQANVKAFDNNRQPTALAVDRYPSAA